LFRRNLLFLSLALVSCWPAVAATTWTQPTPEELKMTSDPKAPGAEAVYLNVLINSDEREHTETVYARLKILTDGGIKDYSDVHMEYVQDLQSIHAVEGRTIHSDGTIVTFSGAPFDKERVSAGGYRFMEKVFSMPDVQVGSILEYRYQLHTDMLIEPEWYVQQPVLVHHAEFHYIPSTEYGVQSVQILPPGVKVTGGSNGYDLKMDDVPGLPDEEDSPPRHAVGYRVSFFYTYYNSVDEYWKERGQQVSAYFNDITAPSAKLRDAVDQMVAPGDSDQQKLEKIYAAVMMLENTSFTRERTKEENKAQKTKSRNATDIWTAQRGNEDELAILFVGMAKAAKMKAYIMWVTDRDRGVFLRAVPDFYQMDDFIAIVNVDGKDMYFDPGQRYCEFGKLKWIHTWTGGVRQTDGSGAALTTTPTPQLTDADITRKAQIQIDADGTVHGIITISMTGDAALRWRQEALRTDEDGFKKEFEDELQTNMAPGVRVKTNQFTALTDYTQPLVATVDVSGSMGTKTGHRVFLPGTFFEAQAKAPFASTNRESPVYMHYPYTMQDQVKFTLPATASVESAPQDAQIPFVPNADFASKYRYAGTTYMYARRVRVANILYDPKDYPSLRDFFQKVNSQDQGQVVVKFAAAGDAAGGTGNSGKNE
jgi:hypothetical protein